jgi:lipoprotein-anchoring transpeptidase ErfK/SrfK
MVYIYATVKVGQWDWYLVGPGHWLPQQKVARVLPAARPKDSSEKWVSIDLFEKVLTAYDGDKMVFATLVSPGLPEWQTNVGVFKVWKRLTTAPMSGAMGQPDFYSLPAVPYVMYFDNDISLHGTYWHDGYGFNHSHGCVNLSISDAHWLFNWTTSDELTVQVIKSA